MPPLGRRTPIVGDPSAGKTASAACAGCHGEQGVSSNPAWPSLAGQDARYLADALKAYKDGSRTDATMKALVASLDDRTINDIASYYAGLAPAQPSATGASSKADPVLVSNRIVASLDERTINDIASYYAGLPPGQPSATGTSTKGDPVLVSNNVVASLDERAIDDVASYFASLHPTQPAGAQSAAGGLRDPVLVRNGLLAGLGEGTINNVASYYATQRPEQPAGARGAPGGPHLSGSAALGQSMAAASVGSSPFARTIRRVGSRTTMRFASTAMSAASAPTGTAASTKTGLSPAPTVIS